MAYNFSIDVDSGSTHTIPVNTDLTTYDVFLELRDSEYVKYDQADLTVGVDSVVLVISQPAIDDYVNKAYRLKATKNGITHIYQSGVVSDNRVTAGPTPGGGGDGTGPINPDRIVADSITSEKIVAGAVTASKLAANSVSTGSIAAGSVVSSKLADSSVINEKLNNNSVSLSKLSVEVTAKLLSDEDRLKLNSSGTDGAQGPVGEKGPTGDKGLTGDKGPRGDVGTTGTQGDKGLAGDKGEVGDKGVTGDKGPIGDSGNAVLVDGSVVTTKIADGAVTAAKIANVVITNAHVATNAAINADKLAAGTTNKMFTATEKTKLAGLATVATSGSYNDLGNLPTIPVVPAYGTAADTVTQGNDVRLSDARTPLDASVTAAKLTDGIISNNHVSSTAAINADKITAGTTNSVFTVTEKSKLSGIASGATANSSNAVLLARANHTGTQAATTITGLATVATSGVYSDLTGRPTLATVATSGSYTDLTNQPTLLTIGTTSTTAAAGNDSRLSDARTPTDASVTAVKIATGVITNTHISSTAAISADKIVAGSTNSVFTVTEKNKLGGLATVATTGTYSDLVGRPAFATVATSGSYSDLLNRPSVAVVNKYSGSAYPTRPTADVVIWRGTVDPGSAALDGDYWDDVN